MSDGNTEILRRLTSAHGRGCHGEVVERRLSSRCLSCRYRCRPCLFSLIHVMLNRHLLMCCVSVNRVRYIRTCADWITINLVFSLQYVFRFLFFYYLFVLFTRVLSYFCGAMSARVCFADASVFTFFLPSLLLLANDTMHPS